jgi:hypothetical protein
MRYSRARHSSSDDVDVAHGLRSREKGNNVSGAYVSIRWFASPRENPRNDSHFAVRPMNGTLRSQPKNRVTGAHGSRTN